MAEDFDLVILGSGSTAFAAALRAEEIGKTAAMTEVRTLGGTCVNRGCLPSRNLIEAAKILYDAKHPRYPGLSPTLMRFDFRALIEQKDAVIEYYRGKKYQSIISNSESIRMFEGAARFSGPNEVTVNGPHLGPIHRVHGLVMRLNTCEIIERDRQIRSTGVGCGLGKNDIRTFASGAYDQPPTLPRSDLRASLTGNHGLVRSPTLEKRLKWTTIKLGAEVAKSDCWRHDTKR